MLKKALILAGGLGTRFLPITKAVPKEMLPVVDKPALHYIAEEAERAGIEKIAVLISGGKEAARRYFAPDKKLEKLLSDGGKTELLRALRSAYGKKIEFLTQNEPLGSGHAVMCAREFIGGDDFAVLNGDDLIYSAIPAVGQLADCFFKTGKTIIGVQNVPRAAVSKYGIVRVTRSEGALHYTDGIDEKPAPDKARGTLAALGRYILRNDIFAELERLKPVANGEIQLTDALNAAAARGSVAAFEFTGRRYDLGSKAGYIEANIDFALRHPETREAVLSKLRDLDGGVG